MTGSPADLRATREAREALVYAHMETENRHEFGAALDTFGHARYEIVATGQVFDGAEEVASYYRTSRTAFPDQRNKVVSLRHAEDAVFVEFDLMGTHLGELYGLAPTGREFTCRMVAMFLFEGERLVCERIYLDSAAILSQLGFVPGSPPGPPRST